MTKLTQLLSLAAGLAFTTPVFAHDLPSYNSTRDGRHYAALYDLNHDGRVSSSEVKRVESNLRRQRERERLARVAAVHRDHVRTEVKAHELTRNLHTYQAPPAR